MNGGMDKRSIVQKGRMQGGREGERNGGTGGQMEGEREERLASVEEKNRYSNETSLHNTRQNFLFQTKKKDTEVYGRYDNS